MGAPLDEQESRVGRVVQKTARGRLLAWRARSPPQKVVQ